MFIGESRRSRVRWVMNMVNWLVQGGLRDGSTETGTAGAQGRGYAGPKRVSLPLRQASQREPIFAGRLSTVNSTAGGHHRDESEGGDRPGHRLSRGLVCLRRDSTRNPTKKPTLGKVFLFGRHLCGQGGTPTAWRVRRVDRPQWASPRNGQVLRAGHETRPNVGESGVICRQGSAFQTPDRWQSRFCNQIFKMFIVI